MIYSLTWLPEVLEAAGLKVAEQTGWRSRGRGDVGAVCGVMCHHTGTAHAGVMPSLRLITEGRSDLAGPLAQLALGRDGTFFVIAAGRANHAGRGCWQGVESGNTRFIGIEAENGGTPADAWPEVQMDAYRRGVAAILRRLSVGADMCCGHREYALPAGRKCDPHFDMDRFRADVHAIMAGNGEVRPPIPRFDSRNRPTLRRGARGVLAAAIQHKVGVVPDGCFGAATEAALRRFQRSHGLVPDGIAGPASWAALDAA
jgi:peptidoglycan hydrolase-like protein with peptidoglycan-binding domain